MGGLEHPPKGSRSTFGGSGAGELIVQGQPELHGKFLGSLGYTARLLSLKEQVHETGEPYRAGFSCILWGCLLCLYA